MYALYRSHTHCSGQCTAMPLQSTTSYKSEKVELTWEHFQREEAGETFDAILKFGGTITFWRWEIGQHHGNWRFAGKNRRFRRLPPLRSCESLALKLLLQQSLIWEFQEKFHAPRAPIANGCGCVAFYENTKESKEVEKP